MSKTVLVTGGSGLLGRQIVDAFDRAGWKAVGTGFTRANPPSTVKLDVTNSGEINKVLDDVKPQVVVHSAAQRFPDRVDADPAAARALNIDASKALANATNARSILLIYISTDYVFPGTPGDAPYEITTTPKAANLYGQTKLDGEHAVHEATQDTGRAVTLRVPVLYGPATENKESAVNTLVDAVWKAQKEDVAMDDWSIRYPTNTEDVGRVCADIASKYLSSQNPKDMPRTLQFSSEDRFTKYQMCELFAEILGLPMGQMKANKAGNDPNDKVQRPYDCHLSTKALKDLGIDVQTQSFTGWWRREMKAYRK